jgi:hypothetical protein
MADAYIFQADFWCNDCIRTYLKDREEVMLAFPDLMVGGEHLISTEYMLAALIEANGRDPVNPATWDSDEFPKGPESDGGGESDTPAHCCQCHTFLENPLTGDGYEYVLEQLRDGSGDADVLAEWRRYYGDDHMIDREPPVTLNEVLDTEDTGPDDWLMSGDWFEDAEGMLYIVPQPDVMAECYGPDNDIVDKINAACRDHDKLNDTDVAELGLTRIQDFLKRYDEGGLGYYHA